MRNMGHAFTNPKEGNNMFEGIVLSVKKYDEAHIVVELNKEAAIQLSPFIEIALWIDGDAVQTPRTNLTISAGKYQQNEWAFADTMPALLSISEAYTLPSDPNSFIIPNPATAGTFNILFNDRMQQGNTAPEIYIFDF